MKRTGSRCSRVPPALTATRRPVRSRLAARPAILGSARIELTTANSSAGSGSRPGPESGPVSRPESGSTTTAPRSRRTATLDWVAGCSHISVCMAGAKITGARAVSSTLVSRSSAWPVAARASRSAVAGATTTRSVSWPSLTCGTRCASSNTPVCTGRPDSAAQVAAPTNSSAAAVGTTVTSCPAPWIRRSSSQALYAAMPPVTPRMILLTGRVPYRVADTAALPSKLSLCPRWFACPVTVSNDTFETVTHGWVRRDRCRPARRRRRRARCRCRSACPR